MKKGERKLLKGVITTNYQISRTEFFEDKGLLFFIFMLEVFSFYLYIEFYKETQFFLVPTTLFGMLGLFELWYIQSKKFAKGHGGEE